LESYSGLSAADSVDFEGLIAIKQRKGTNRTHRGWARLDRGRLRSVNRTAGGSTLA
jgi:hypothetical protein